MIGNPLALLGLLAVAVPIVIHLLGRHRTRVARFPTLRFIGTSRLNPAQRRRITDWPLLLVRMAILGIAAIALSQPTFGDEPGGSTNVSRAIIVDSSASMFRLVRDAAGTPGGSTTASLRAHAIADSVTAGVVSSTVEAESPGDAVPGAVAWLASQSGLRELVIVSDFQRSSIDSTSLAAVPADVGVTLIPVAAGPVSVARATTEVSISTFAGAADLPGADVAWRAIGRARPPAGDGRVAIIYSGHAAADSLARASVPVDSAWMARLVAAVERDPLVIAAGEAGIRWGRNGTRLTAFVPGDAGSVASAALNQALVRVTAAKPAASESDSTSWQAVDIARWQRPPGRRPVEPSSQERDNPSSRILWALALALLILETWMRSRTRKPSGASVDVAPSPPREHAA